MAFDLTALIDCLDLTRTGDATFEGANLPLDYRRIFGGQLLAQSVRALQACAGDKQLKSFTQHFPREGDVAAPVEYEVSFVHSGRTFATCAVAAGQGGKPVSAMSASLHVPEPGIERQDAVPEVGTPEDATPVDLGMVPWEVRSVGGVDLGSRASHPPVFRFWMRADDLPARADVETPWLHQALLAHATDLTVIGTALLPVEGLSQDDTMVRFHSAVTSHSMWFHAPFRMDEWLLVDQHSPVLSGSRAWGRADVWTQDGRLVASLAQESMVRMLA